MSIARVRELCRNLVIERLKNIAIYRIIFDFDGCVFSTESRTTEGTAVSYNKKKKGARSYYPLFCTLPKPGRSSMSIIAWPMFTIPMDPGNLSSPV
jgi:hypothetical protein